jgi:long-chain acyl-CoA synthetase
MVNLSVVLEDSAREEPTRAAIVLGNTRLTYAQVDAMANQVANALAARGIGPGDTVALTCPNLPWFPVVYFGILKIGATVVPLNVLLKRREIAYHLADAGAKVYFCFEGTPDLPMGAEGWAAFEETEGCAHFVYIPADPRAASPYPGTSTLAQLMADKPRTFDTHPTSPDDVAVILYTSGTTGQPKGAALTHANLLFNMMLTNKMFPPHPHDVHLVTLPMFHSFGQCVQLGMGFYTRSTLVLLPRFDAVAALRLMDSEGVTFFAGVPTMYWAMLAAGPVEGVDLAKVARTLRIAVSGGAALPVAVLEGVKERFGVEILEGYGLSETSPVATFNRTDRPKKPGTVGLPVWGVQVKLVDLEGKPCPVGERGEVLIRGHNVMKGYHGRPEATAAAIDARGWFRTGDIGVFDAEGYLSIVDRAKDMIIRGGFNVYPREIEEVLLTHPAISLAAVVGVPNPEHGEEVKAYVIKKAGAVLTEPELVAWCREQMAAYKYPRLVEFRDSLPMTATGKILKRELA